MTKVSSIIIIILNTKCLCRAIFRQLRIFEYAVCLIKINIDLHFSLISTVQCNKTRL